MAMTGFYPPRFKTLEDAQKALYKNDFSGQVLPFESKKYEGMEDQIIPSKEYEDARFELQFVTREGGIKI